MGQYVARRLLYMIVVLFVVALITFTLMHAVPGGPVISTASGILKV